MRAVVKADVRTGKVYSVPFATVREARRFCMKAHRPYRAVLIYGTRVECYEEGQLITTEKVS